MIIKLILVSDFSFLKCITEKEKLFYCIPVFLCYNILGCCCTSKSNRVFFTICLSCLDRDNILVLDIFFEALNYETIEQKKAYEVAGLLGIANNLSSCMKYVFYV